MTVPSLEVYVQGQGAVSADNMNTWIQGGAIAEQLRQITGVPGMTVLLSGITTIDDGGGGFFWWNPLGNEPDDNANFITPVGTFVGQWTRLTLPFPTLAPVFPSITVTGPATFQADVTVEGLFAESYSGSLVATGSTQATALLLTSNVNTFITVAAGTGALLPSTNHSGSLLVMGTSIKVLNRGASVLSVYPPVGHQIETVGVNNPVGIAVNGNATYTYAGGTQWRVS